VRIAQFAAAMADSAGLKSTIQLAHENAASPDREADARRIIEAQLVEIHKLVGYDLAITDWNGQTLGAMEFRDGAAQSPRQMPTFPDRPSLLEFEGVLYELSAVPVTLGPSSRSARCNWEASSTSGATRQVGTRHWCITAGSFTPLSGTIDGPSGSRGWRCNAGA
jgi:hypothetical protein